MVTIGAPAGSGAAAGGAAVAGGAVAADAIGGTDAPVIAAQPNYGPLYNVLFAFLLVVDAGLMGIAWRGEPKWLHAAGGVATLIVFIIWFRLSFTDAAWPALLLWAALFIGLYLILYGIALIVMVRYAPHGLVGWMYKR